jgi:integrase
MRALPKNGRGVWRDADHSGLEVRGNRSGGSWCLRHRVRGQRLRDVLGRWPDLTVTAARKAASVLVEAAALKQAAGGDVLADRNAKRAARDKVRGTLTLKQALDAYAKDRLSSLRSGAHAEAVLRRVFAAILPRSLAETDMADVIACIDAKRTTAPSAAEQAIRYGKPFWGWLAERGHGANLLDGVKAKQTRKRERTLTMSELGQILVTLDEMGVDAPALVIRTLMATAGRLNEVAAMRVTEIEGDLWTLPSDRNKSGRVHLVPLNSEALAAVAQGVGTDIVFPGRTGGPFNGWSRFKARLDKASNVSGWVFHDFRRTFATICADRGVDPIVADRCLNHAASGTQSTVMRIYQRSEMLDARRAAFNIWAEAIVEARAIAMGAKVVEMKG